MKSPCNHLVKVIKMTVIDAFIWMTWRMGNHSRFHVPIVFTFIIFQN